MEFNHALYVASEIEKLLLSEAAVKYGNLSLEYFANKNRPADISETRFDIQTMMDSAVELIDLVPMQFPVSMLYRDVDGRMTWTVNISRSTSANTATTCAGRSRSRNHATLASLIRLFVQEQLATAIEKQAVLESQKAAEDPLDAA